MLYSGMVKFSVKMYVTDRLFAREILKTLPVENIEEFDA